MLKEVIWKFTLPRTHTGMALGNATSGLLVWEEQNHIKITYRTLHRIQRNGL